MHFLNVFGNVAVCCIFAVCGVRVNLSAIFEIIKKDVINLTNAPCLEFIGPNQCCGGRNRPFFDIFHKSLFIRHLLLFRFY